ncbi:cytochrome c oxidase subunit II [Roseisolibacter agri]|uniref:cytochrome-c oxidase n=1 Tax=Roseisolibacter agri TaxID=2014610 RepID=A0AA37PZL7_9BACT|nr:cytochrome c oxidase subunit II [Roseisolibacter agri]GLC23915.1 cytochrome c oxidase subunit II [Roseisolibacter agri]
MQGALDAAGPQAAHIARLWWIALGVSAVVYALTMAALFVAVTHRKRAPAVPTIEPAPDAERRGRRWVGAAVGATIVVLFAFLFADLVTTRALAAIERPREMLTVRVTGMQWWWRVEYRDTVSARTVTTANEIHVPVGRPVLLELESGDVIHSIWIPTLHGKRDLVPGQRNVLTVQADRPGIYRGECAEFCGHQHAKMALVVVAEPEAQFRAWYAAQHAEARPPADSLQLAGQQVFMSKACAVCHQIRGTPAGGRVAPDLTHLASRRSLAAGTLPNTRGHLAGWIIDPQSLKPGTRMPANEMRPDELRALLAYLESLR